MTDAILRLPDGKAQLPRIPATDGEDGLDVSRLLDATGALSLDYGFVHTAACRSAITFIDGDAGILRYRGYPIEQLAQHSSFVEVTYLLINGELPTETELADFDETLRGHTLLHEELRRFFDGFPSDAHPMSVLSSAVSALSTFYQDALDPFDPEQVRISAARLLAKVPVIAAYSLRHALGQPMLYPDNSLDLVSNFLRLTFGWPSEPFDVSPVVHRALDQLLILHADHEQNCSTSTVRMVGSSHANLFASVSAGINALFGPLHGGANQAVVEMLTEIRDSGESPAAFVERAKRHEGGFRLMGFGHRVYRNYDPRATIVKETSHKVLKALNVSDPLLDIALELEQIALADDYFLARKLYPNVDFFTGVIYRAMGFPTRMFPVLFAIGRLPGWIAHWCEMIADPETKISRPRQIYEGPAARDFVPLADR